MVQTYSWRSVRNSLTNTAKINLENINSVEEKNYSNKISEKLQKYAKNWDKLVYTFCILFTYLICGITGTLFAPAMVDLKFLYRTTMAKINYGNTFGQAGYITGSLTGFLYKYINRQLSFMVAIVLMAIFGAAQVACAHMWQYYGSNFLNTFGFAVFDSGNTVWVAEMWAHNSAPIFQLSQMMYGIGAIIGPLLVSPYLYGDLSNKTETTGSPIGTLGTTLTTISSTTTVPINTTVGIEDINYSVDRRSKLIIPFFIGGALSLLTPTILLVMFFLKRYKIPENRIQSLNKKNESDPATNGEVPIELSGNTRKVLIALVAISLSSYTCLEMTFFSYSSTYYQYLPIRLSASTAAHVMSVMSGTYCFGRGVSALISTRLKPEVMIIYHMIIIAISLAILYLGDNSEALIYTGNALIGFGFSAIFPSISAFSEKYIKLTNKVTSIYSFASSFCSIGATLLLGPIIDKYPQVVLQVEFAMLCSNVVLLILILITLKRSQRYPISYTLNNETPR